MLRKKSSRVVPGSAIRKLPNAHSAQADSLLRLEAANIKQGTFLQDSISLRPSRGAIIHRLAVYIAQITQATIEASLNTKGFQRQWALILAFIAAFQPVCLALSASTHFPWQHASMTKPIADMLGVFSMGYFSNISSEASLLLFGFAGSLLWLLALAVAVKMYGTELLRKHKASERPWKPKWVLRFMHSSYQLLTGAAFVPVLMSLLSPARCSSREVGEAWISSVPCWSIQHQVFLSISMVVAFFFSLWAALCSLLHVQTQFDEPDAKVHGRAHAASILLRASAALIVTTAGLLPMMLIILVLTCCTALELYLWVKFVPYRSPRLNSALISGSAGALFVVAALILSQLEGAPYHNAEWAIAVCLPLALIASFMAGMEHLQLLANSKAPLRTPYQVERKTRSILDNSAFFVLNGIDEATRASIRSRHTTQIEESAPGLAMLGVAQPMQATLRQVEHLIALSHLEMPKSRFLHLVAADFLRTWFNNPHIERSYVEAVLRLGPSFDEAFLARLWSEQLEAAALRRDAKHLKIQERVQFEELKDDALSNELRARGFLNSFWTSLGGRRPAVDRLIKLSYDIEEAVDDAEESYDAMLHINRRNVTVLRSYAQFMGDVLNDPAGSSTLLMEAEAVEEEQSHEHTKRLEKFQLFQIVGALDSSAENIAVASISDQAKTLGHMTEVNAAVCSTFGYTRAELLGKNVSMLTPEPIASMHDHFLKAYLRSGKATSIGSVRMAFGVHSTGYIFPILLAVRSLRSGFGGLMQPVATKHNFIMFGSKSSRVIGACKASMSLLNTSAEQIKNSTVFLSKHLRNWRLLRRLASESGGEDDEYFWENKQGLATDLKDAGLVPDALQGGCWGAFRNISPQFFPSGCPAVALQHIVQRTGKRNATCRAWMKVQLMKYPISPPNAANGTRPSNTDDTLGILMWEAGLPHAEMKELQRKERDSVKHSQMVATLHATAAVSSMQPIKGASFNANEEPRRVDSASDDNSNDADSLAGLLDDGALTEDGSLDALDIQTLDASDSKREVPDTMQPSVVTMVALDSSAHPKQAGQPTDDSNESKEGKKPLVSVLKKTSSFSVPAVDDVTAGTPIRAQTLSHEEPSAALLRSSTTAAFASPKAVELASGLSGLSGLDKAVNEAAHSASRSHEEDDALSAAHTADDDKASSIGSNDSQAAISTVLRRTVTAANEQPELAVLSLRRAVLGVLSLTVFFIVAGAVTLNVLLGTYNNSLAMLHDCAERQVQGEELALLAKDLQMLSLSLSASHDDGVLREFNEGKQQLLDLLETFDARHQGVYSNIHVFVDAAAGQDELHTKTPLGLTSVEDGQSLAYKRMLNDAVFEFMGHLRAIANTSPQRLADDLDGHLLWLELNTRSSLMPALNKSTMLMDTTFRGMAADSEGLQLGLLAASVSLLGMVALCMVIPMTWKAIAARDRIWQLMFNIPIRVINLLQRRTESKMDALKAQSSDADMNMQTEQLDEFSNDDFSSLNRLQYRQSSGSKSGRKLASSYCDILWTVTVFILPLLVAVGYYGGTFVWSADTTDKIAGSGHTLLWSYQREAWSLTLLGSLMTSLIQNNDTIALQEIGGALSAASSLTHIQHQLVYGDGLIQAARVSPERVELMLHDGCVTPATPEYPGCDQMYSGVLLNGAQAGVAEFVTRARLVLLGRSAEIKGNSSVSRLNRIGTTEMSALRLFGKRHLRESLRRASLLVSDYTDQLITDFSDVHTILTGMVIGTLVFGFLLLQVPIMKRLDEQVKRSRATLLYLPPAAVEDIPALRQLLVLAGVVSASQLKRIRTGAREF